MVVSTSPTTKRGWRDGPDEPARCGVPARRRRRVAHAHRLLRDLRGPGPGLRRPARAVPQQAAPGAPVPPEGAVRAGWHRPAGVGGRPPLPAGLPRPSHRAPATGGRRDLAQPDGPADVPGARSPPAAVGDLGGRRAGLGRVGDDLQGAPLHGRRDLRHRPDGGGAGRIAGRLGARGRQLGTRCRAQRCRAGPRRDRRDAGQPSGDRPLAARWRWGNG
jgi:hypothetical protein